MLRYVSLTFKYTNHTEIINEYDVVLGSMEEFDQFLRWFVLRISWLRRKEMYFILRTYCRLPIKC